MLCILKDLGSDSRHKLYKKFCRAEESAMKVFMTGATEFLGSHFVENVISRGYA